MQQEGTTGARVPTTVQLRHRFPNSTVAVGGENRAVSVPVVHSRTTVDLGVHVDFDDVVTVQTKS